MTGRRLRVLAVTSLFPNSAEPHSSAFNRQQITELAKLTDMTVWAPVPWFPLARAVAPSSSAARVAEVKKHVFAGGLDISHPRTLQLPLVGRPIAGPLYAASLVRRLARFRKRFDVILATWAYPDGWATTVLGRLLGLPVVVKVHGTDINVVAQKPAQRAQLRAVLPRAAGVIAVSRALAERVADLGVDGGRIHWIPNGVDRERFSGGDKADARSQLGIGGVEVVVYIGNLKREKGVFDLLDAWPEVAARRPRAELFVIGGGPESEAVGERCAALPSVRAVGPVPHADVATWLAACDLLCLPSWNEGMPNVVLEAHASGRPVVATRVGGIPDLVDSPSLGTLVEARDPAALAAALVDTLAGPSTADAVRSASQIISWSESAELVFEVLSEAAR